MDKNVGENIEHHESGKYFMMARIFNITNLWFKIQLIDRLKEDQID